jgi:radical SAM superfamily enzyme YgiQ (UPF0313 family)
MKFKMRIQLIYLNSTKEEFLPFGIAHISSILKENGFDVNIIDTTFGMSQKDIIKKISKFSPDIIGMSSMSVDFLHAVSLKNKILENGFDIPIILGGVHATVAPEESIKHFDIVCRGEGEYPFFELANKIKENFFNIKNFWFKRNGVILKLPLRPLIKDLDRLPFVDREGFNYNRYLRSRDNQADFLSGRGCAFNCNYCINYAIKKNYHSGPFIRKRSVNNLIEEIEQTRQTWKIKSILFHDDLFVYNKKWLKEFSIKYSSEIGLPFFCNSRVEFTDKESLILLKKSGCEQLEIGIESGSEKIRNNVLNRRMKNSQIIKVFQSAKKIGIRTKSYNMIGIPFENESNIQETINLNKMIQPDEVQVSFFTAYPGTKLYDICKENGWISSKLPSSYFTDTNVNYLQLPKNKIKEYYKRFAFDVYSKTDFKKAMLYFIKANFYPSYQRIRDKIPDRFKGIFWQSSSLRA